MHAKSQRMPGALPPWDVHDRVGPPRVSAEEGEQEGERKVPEVALVSAPEKPARSRW